MTDSPALPNYELINKSPKKHVILQNMKNKAIDKL